MASLPKMRPTFLFFLKKENNDFVHSSIKTWKKLIIQISRPPLKGIPIVSGFLATDSPVVDVKRFHGFLSFFFWVYSLKFCCNFPRISGFYCSAAVGIPSAPVTEAFRIFFVFFFFLSALSSGLTKSRDHLNVPQIFE